MQEHWQNIQLHLIQELDENGLWDGSTFKVQRLEAFLEARGIAWPRTGTGRLKIDDDTLSAMGKVYPEIRTIHQLRHTLSALHLNKLAVGVDGRNRTLISPFSSRTGRNQPSTSKYIFGLPAWIRSLIQPPEGKALAYVDWAQQEFGIAAALSLDKLMQAAYDSGDPYLAFAKQAGAVPEDATKASHGRERELFKVCALGVQYGMGVETLARHLSEPVCVARNLLELHQMTYRTYWRWSEATVNQGLLGYPLQTVFGWQMHPGDHPKPRSLANFPMQANGAEMLRLACCLATEQGITVCAPVHDAILVEADISEIDGVVCRTQRVMEEASRIVLDGFPLRSDVQIIRHPDRFRDPRGQEMWDTVTGILAERFAVAA
jgi:hypothetical protein